MNHRRLLLVHAHPDDESIATGGAMARYVTEGAHVALVTCTRGEQGEIVPDDLKHLGTGKLLADARVEELAAAMDVLGVTDHRFLGPYEDSGMIGTPENERGSAFWNADLDEASAHLVKVIREVRPQVVVTYDENGGYGHPDHIQAHRVTMLAVEAARPDWAVAKVYYCVWVDEQHAGPAPTTTLDIAPFYDRKLAAIAAHRTQATVDGRTFALADRTPHPIHDVEHYLLAHGTLGPTDETTGRETDLFAGVNE